MVSLATRLLYALGNGPQTTEEFERNWEEVVWSYYPGIYLEGLRKNMKTFIRKPGSRQRFEPGTSRTHM
jgi:hypothetical protein